MRVARVAGEALAECNAIGQSYEILTLALSLLLILNMIGVKASGALAPASGSA